MPTRLRKQMRHWTTVLATVAMATAADALTAPAIAAMPPDRAVTAVVAATAADTVTDTDITDFQHCF
jgi:hypothetical protein